MPLVEGVVETEKNALELSEADILPDRVIVSLALLEEELDNDTLTDTQPEELELIVPEIESVADGDPEEETVLVVHTDEDTLSEYEAVPHPLFVTEMEDDAEKEFPPEKLEITLAELIGVALLYKLPLTLDDRLGLDDELTDALSCTEYDDKTLIEATKLTVRTDVCEFNGENDTDGEKLCKAEEDTLAEILGLADELADRLSRREYDGTKLTEAT